MTRPVMTRLEAYGLIDDLSARLRDETALRRSLEEDVAMYREMLTVALTELNLWQLDAIGQERRQQQMARGRCAFVMEALLANVRQSEAA